MWTDITPYVLHTTSKGAGSWYSIVIPYIQTFVWVHVVASPHEPLGGWLS